VHPLKGVLYAFALLLFVSVTLSAVATAVGIINTATRMLDTESLKISSKPAADWRFLTHADTSLTLAAVTAVIAAAVGAVLAFFKHTAKR